MLTFRVMFMPKAMNRSFYDRVARCPGKLWMLHLCWPVLRQQVRVDALAPRIFSHGHGTNTGREWTVLPPANTRHR